MKTFLTIVLACMLGFVGYQLWEFSIDAGGDFLWGQRFITQANAPKLIEDLASFIPDAD